MLRRCLLLFALACLPALARADKIIMKDGKIYEGRIMGENQKAVLISNPPIDPKPRFIEMRNIMTIVRDRRIPEEPSPEEGRFASANVGVSGMAFSSNIFSFSPTAGLYVGGGFRVHPSVELGGEFEYLPSLSGSLTVSDGTHFRGYDSYYAYHGGFSAKVFPFFKKRDWRAEPYLTAGYHWNRLVPKASGDAFKGNSILGGAGVMLPWWRPLYWDFRFLYEHTTYDSINFVGGEGSLSDVTHDSYGLSVGLSYRFL